MRRNGYPWVGPTVHVVRPGTTIDSACGEAAGEYELVASPAFYCPVDDGIYLDTSWLYRQLWTLHLDESGYVRPGDDLAVGFVVAHEVGHAVQDQRNIERPAGAPNKRPTELQADCFAGMWADDKYLRRQLDSAKIGAAYAAAEELADEQFDSPNHHGTPAERSAAFRADYRGGTLASCPLDVGA